MKWKGWGMPPRDTKSVSLNASYNKEQQYNWFRGGVLNSFFRGDRS